MNLDPLTVIIPKLVQMRNLKKLNHNESWLVQLATRTKKKVSEVVKRFPLVMNGLITYGDLNVLSLSSCDVIIGMDWLESHREKLDCYNNNFEFLDEEGKLKVVKGIPKVISGRNSSATKLKKFYGKGCRVYSGHVLEETEYDTPRL